MQSFYKIILRCNNNNKADLFNSIKILTFQPCCGMALGIVKALGQSI